MADPPIPGSFPFKTDYSTMAQPTPSTNMSLWREGRFDDLSKFVNTDVETLNTIRERYRPVTAAELRPGSVIHVRDNNPSETRLHHRIFLVKAMNPPSMICYSFCFHDPELTKHDALIHWRVAQKEKLLPQDASAGFSSLEVYLHYNASLQSNITINLRDPWNVEYNVYVAKLGEVTDAAWENVRKRINQIFTWDEQLSDSVGSATYAAMKRQISGGGENQSNTKTARKTQPSEKNKSNKATPSPHPSPKERERRVSVQYGKWKPLFPAS